MSAGYENIVLSIYDNGIAHLTINRPEKLNALNNAVFNELDSVFDTVSNDKQIKALILRGAGEKAFVAGADISELANLDKKSGRVASEKGQRIFQKIENCPKPVIAVVHGYALGGGAELALAAHMRIATPDAVFGLPEVSLGLIPGYGGTQRLTKLIGKTKAMQMILTGSQIKADDALQYGLVNQIEEGDTVEAATSLLLKILKNSPVALSKAIKAINAADTADGFETEAALFGDLCQTDDFKEGISAFLEKRKPEFTGK